MAVITPVFNVQQAPDPLQAPGDPWILPQLKEQWELAYQEAILSRQTANEKAKAHLDMIKMIDAEIADYQKAIADAQKRYDELAKLKSEQDISAEEKAWTQQNRKDLENLQQRSSTNQANAKALAGATEFNAEAYNKAQRTGAMAKATSGKIQSENEWEDFESERAMALDAMKSSLDENRDINQFADVVVDKYSSKLVNLPARPGEDPTVVRERIPAGNQGTSENLRRGVQELFAKTPIAKRNVASIALIENSYKTMSNQAERDQFAAVVRDELRNMGGAGVVDEFDKIKSIYDMKDLTKSDYVKGRSGGSGGTPGYTTIGAPLITAEELETATELDAGETAMRDRLASNIDLDAARQELEQTQGMYQPMIDTAMRAKSQSTGVVKDWLGSDPNTIDVARQIYKSRFGMGRFKNQSPRAQTSQPLSIQDEIASLSPTERAKLQQLFSQPQTTNLPANQSMNAQAMTRMSDSERPVSPDVAALREISFQRWYSKVAADYGLDPNPDHPEHFYDWRAAHKAGVTPELDRATGEVHWPSEFKLPGHPREFIEQPDGTTLNTRTGEVIKAPIQAVKRSIQPPAQTSIPLAIPSNTEPIQAIRPDIDYASDIYGPSNFREQPTPPVVPPVSATALDRLTELQRKEAIKQGEIDMSRAYVESRKAAAKNRTMQIDEPEKYEQLKEQKRLERRHQPGQRRQQLKEQKLRERKYMGASTSSGSTSQSTLKQTHREQVVKAMSLGRELSFQDKKLARLLANDPVSKQTAKLYEIDRQQGATLEAQIEKIASAYSNEPAKQNRALEVLFALRNKQHEIKYMKDPEAKNVRTA